MKAMYVDIGELGWSLYLSAHVRWLKQHTDDHIGVMTHADRCCLYNGVADAVYKVPEDFYGIFRRGTEVYFGLKGISDEELRDYFAKRIPNDYELRGFFSRYNKIKTKAIFKLYEYSKTLEGKKEILIFPRYRNTRHSSQRNLSKSFYAEVINVLCAKFPDYIVRTIGIPSGAYSVNGIKRTNYINDVRQDADLQTLIDRCQVAVAAIGSQSAPPKLTLLQGVPTFMIGHQRARHENGDNWMSTKVEFYDVSKKNYASIDIKDCINKIVSFVEGC